MAEAVTLTVEQKLATLRLGREHGNAINADLLECLGKAVREAEQDPEVRGVLLAACGKLFSPGLDLQELIELDRPTMQRSLELLNATVLRLYTLSKPLVAAIHGHAVAGGCVLCLAADWRVLKQGAAVGLNEVLVGVPFPYGVSLLIRETVPRHRLAEVALFGRNFTGQDAVDAGLVDEVVPEEAFEDRCRERLTDLAGKDANAFAITKRYLRSGVVERIRAAGSSHDREFLDGWFSPATQQRIRAIVAELTNRKK